MSITLRLTSRLAVFIFLIAAIPAGAQESDVKVSTPDQIKEDFNTVPCEDKKRLESVKSLFERAGVPSSEITIDKHKDVENLSAKVNPASVYLGYRLVLAMVVRFDQSPCAAYK